MNKKMKFRGHDTFFIRKGWLHKGMKNVKNDAELFINKNQLPTDVLGMGSNMVKALRYWLQVVGLTTEPKSGKRTQTITSLGEIIYKNDPYFEELGTLWLLHYNLAKNEENATSWYFFFNEFQMQEFKKEDFCLALKKYISMHSETEVADTSLENDFDCLMNTYIARAKSNPGKVHPENNIDCPLGELNLVDIKDRKEKLYTKVIPPKASIHPLIALAIILDSTEETKENNADANESNTNKSETDANEGNANIAKNDVIASNKDREIKIQTLLRDKNHIGKLFNLDMITLMDILNKLERMGYIAVVRTAGLDVIRIKTTWTYVECVAQYYKSINSLGGE